GLGEGSALPVGVPVPWPSATPPTGWIKCNGAPFSAQEYPELAKAYPTNKLPDLRGEFIRGWDDGRGVDSGRELLSSQGAGAPNITGTMTSLGVVSGVSASGAISGADSGINSTLARGSTSALYNFSFDASKSSSLYQSINEVRPRNIAFNYIVRAA
ncbi:phage tail protein, partial [Escherichia coli]